MNYTLHIAFACTAMIVSGCSYSAQTGERFQVNSGATVAPADDIIEDRFALDGSADNKVAIESWIDHKFRAMVAEEDIPALSVGIVYEGKTFGFFNYGAQARGSSIPVDEHSIFQIASLSKTLTGIVTQSLIAEGKLDSRQSLATYLPDILKPPAQRALDRVTLGQLLQHHSGITTDDCSLYRNRIEGEPWEGGYLRTKLVEDINAIELDNFSKPGAEQGTQPEFIYSNCGYAIVGLIAEIATGQSYAELLNDRVTSKFGLVDTVVQLTEAQKSRLVVPYRKDNRLIATKASDMGAGTPGSGVYSTVSDLLALQLDQIRAYRNFASSVRENELILTDSTFPGPRPHMRYGAGMIEFDHPAAKIYIHDGDADGFAGAYAFSPEHNMGIVMQTSSGGPWVTDLIVETLIGLIEGAYVEQGNER